MAKTDGTVKIGVEVNSNEAKKELEGLGKNGSSILNSIGDAAKKAATVIGASATAAVGFAVDVGMSFESAMSRVKAISGATTEEFAKLQQQAVDLGASTAFSATEAAQGMENLASAGFTVDEIYAAMPGMLDLAASAGEDLATSADIAASTLRGFGLEADQAGHVADVLAKNAAATNAAVADTGDAMKYVAPVAHAMGLSLEEVTASIGIMANAGIQGSQAGTTLRGALTRLTNPTDKMCGVMDRLGLSFFDSEGKMISLTDMTAMLQKQMAGLTDEEKNQALATLFGQEALSGMLALMDAGPEEVAELTKSLVESDGAAKDMADTMLDNLQGAVDGFTGALETMGITIYQSLSEPLKNLAVDGTDAVNQLTEAFNAGGPTLATCATNLMVNFLAGIAAQAPSITTKGAEIISGFMNSVSTNVPRLLNLGTSAVASFIFGIGQQLPELVPQALSMVVTLADAVISNIPRIVDAGIDLLTGLVQGIINSLPTLITEGPRIVNDFADAIYSGVGKLLSTGVKLIIQLGKGIISNMPLIIQNGGQILMALINAFSLSKMLSLGKSLITSVKNGLKNMGPKLVSAGKNVANNAMTAIKSIDWVGTGGNILKMVANGLKSVASLLLNAAKTAAKSAWNAMKGIDWWGVGKNILKGVVNGVKAFAGELVDTALGAVKDAVTAVKNWLGIHSPSRLMENLIGHNMMAGVQVGIEGDASNLQETAVDTMKDVVDAMDISSYVSKLKAIPLPDISSLTGIRVAHQDTVSDYSGQGKTEIDTDDIKDAVKEGIQEGMKGMKVEMDGRETGKVTAPYINEFLPQPAW